MKIRSILLIIGVLAICSCSKFGKVLKSNDYEYKYRMAEQYYSKKQYNYAQQLYEDLFPVFKGSQRFEDLYYKFAFCHYYQKDYFQAENLFKGFLEVFPTSAKSEEVDYMHAYCYYKQSPKAPLDQSNTIKAMGMMQTFINTHPGSERNKDAQAIIEGCKQKLEVKQSDAAQLYYNIGQFRASAIEFTGVLNDYPESTKGDEYKLMVIKSYYKFANLSIAEKQRERYEQVINEVHDFQDRYPESKLLKDAERYLTLSQNSLKKLKI